MPLNTETEISFFIIMDIYSLYNYKQFWGNKLSIYRKPNPFSLVNDTMNNNVTLLQVNILITFLLLCLAFF